MSVYFCLDIQLFGTNSGKHSNLTSDIATNILTIAITHLTLYI
jgi:ABC-type transport system involved in cytochrome c biogenesis permease component